MKTIALFSLGLVFLTIPLFSQSALDKPLKKGDAKDKTEIKTVKCYDVAEFSFEMKSARMAVNNPYLAYQLRVVIRPQAGRSDAPKDAVATINGFFYGNDLYVARWMATEPDGQYEYLATVARPEGDDSLEFIGKFSIKGESSALSAGPLKVSDKHAIWLSDRRGNPFFLMGVWSHGGIDIACITGRQFGPWHSVNPADFNSYYDTAVGEGYIDKQGVPSQKYYDQIDTLLDGLKTDMINMVNITADHMGWGFQCASNWHGKRAGEVKEPFRYDPNSGLIWDYFLEGARQRGIYVKINLQEFCQGSYTQHPFNAIKDVNMSAARERPDDMTTNPVAREAWEKWVTYLTRRYSAFDNVLFQMGNEPPGDGYKLGFDAWKAFDRWTMDIVKSSSARPILYTSGAPVGTAQLNQADYDVDHHNNRKFGAMSCFFIKRNRELPYHVEEIEAYNGKNKDEWLKNCRYLKFAMFAQGGYASALVMWGWKDNRDGTGDAWTRYMQSTKSLAEYVKPALPNLFDLKPDDSIIAQIPGELAKCIRSDNEVFVYFQKRDKNSKMEPLPDQLILKLSDGKAVVNWFDPSAGKYSSAQPAAIKDGVLRLTPPIEYVDDFAVWVSIK